jgi:predicted ester cyclase
LYRDTHLSQNTCTLTAKTRAMLRSTTAVPGLYPDAAFLLTASVRSATFTYFIAGPLGGIVPMPMTGSHIYSFSSKQFVVFLIK